MKIEAGKYYVTRGGDVVGPMKRTDFDDWVWSGKDNYGVDYYLSNGRCFRGGSDPRDLIKEHVMPKFKVGDRVKWGDMAGSVKSVRKRLLVMFDDGSEVEFEPDELEAEIIPQIPSHLDLTKPVQTRDGRKVRLLCTDGQKSRPVVGLVGDEEFPISWHSDGTYYAGALESIYDLVNAPAAPCTFERWFNVYYGGNSEDHATKQAADNMAYPDRIARKRIVFTEGEWDE